MSPGITALIVLLLLAAVWVAWSHFWGAPWVPSSTETVRRMLQLAGVGPEDVVVDLGSGDGRIVVTAVREFGARSVGVEIDPLRLLWSRLRIRRLGLGPAARVVHGDLFAADLREATVVTSYLLEQTNSALASKLRRELRPGARVVTNAFRLPGLHLIAQDPVARVYVYGIPALGSQ